MQLDRWTKDITAQKVVAFEEVKEESCQIPEQIFEESQDMVIQVKNKELDFRQ